MKINWKSTLALFGLVSGLLSAAFLPVPAGSGTLVNILRIGALPGLTFGFGVYLYLLCFEKAKHPLPKVLLWILASTAGSLCASLFTFMISGNDFLFREFPSLIYFSSGVIAAVFIAAGFRVLFPWSFSAKQFVLFLALGGALSLGGVLLVQYFNVSSSSQLSDYFFFGVWQVGMAFALEEILRRRDRINIGMAVGEHRRRSLNK